MAILLCLMLGIPAAPVPPAQQACAIEFRGVPLHQALAEAAERVPAKYRLDAQVPPVALEREIRLSARHLSGEQAFRWVARLGGLEAVRTADGWVVMAQPQAARPQTTRAWHPAKPQAAPPGDRGNWLPRTAPQRAEIAERDRIAWSAARQRRGAVAWRDTPLARVAVDISNNFAVDVVFDPRILEQPVLIRLEAPSADLPSVARALAGQVHATVEFLDGALWVHPAGGVAPASRGCDDTGETPVPHITGETPVPHSTGEMPVPHSSSEAPGPHPAAETALPSHSSQAVESPDVNSQPGGTGAGPATGSRSTTRPAARLPGGMADALAKPVELDRRVQDWAQFADWLARATGLPCQLDAAGGAPYPRVEARGPAMEVLEAMRLLGWLDWRGQNGPRGGNTLIIIVAPQKT